MASPSAGATAFKYGDVNTVTPSPGEVKGLIIKSYYKNINLKIPRVCILMNTENQITYSIVLKIK